MPSCRMTKTASRMVTLTQIAQMSYLMRRQMVRSRTPSMTSRWMKSLRRKRTWKDN